MLVNTGGCVGTAAGAEGDLAAFEVAEEFVPFLVGRLPVFLTRSECSAAGDERAVPVDDLVGVERVC